jgi:hypothetical protein
MKLSPDHRRFLLVEQVVGGGVVNLAIAALLSWLLLRHAERVPVTGSQGVVVDTIASAFDSVRDLSDCDAHRATASETRPDRGTGRRRVVCLYATQHSVACDSDGLRVRGGDLSDHSGGLHQPWR